MDEVEVEMLRRDVWNMAQHLPVESYGHLCAVEIHDRLRAAIARRHRRSDALRQAENRAFDAPRWTARRRARIARIARMVVR